MGQFAVWQPIYAAHGIPTFPVSISGGKRPAVRGYLKVGMKLSERLANKFASAETFGFGLRRARITVLDVDTSDERVLAEALDRHGPTPMIVRTGSGNFQCYYRNSGEPRAIRPSPGRPIDILGDGFTVAPPSMGKKDCYRFVEGSLDDLRGLPPLRGVDDLIQQPSIERIIEGQRNEALFRFLMREAHSCASLDDLFALGASYNARTIDPPLSEAEVSRVAESAWSYTLLGKNRFGVGQHVVVSYDLIDRYAGEDPYALGLLLKLKRHHSGRTDFVLAASMAGHLSWDERRLRRARKRLEDDGEIRCLHRGGRRRGDPPRFGWPELQRKGYKIVPQ